MRPRSGLHLTSSALSVTLQDATVAKTTSDEIASVFERATQGPMRACMLIYFAHADFEETRMNNEKVNKIYSALVEVQEIDPTLVSGPSCWDVG